VVKAVAFLTDLLWEHRGRTWGIGPKGHAIHALAIYDERVFGGQPGQRAAQLAQAQAASDAEARTGETENADLAASDSERTSSAEPSRAAPRQSRSRRVTR
jgi:hypothetical protein